jgi:hypothetical protein
MTNIDNHIRDALSEDDRQFLASLDEERGLFAQVGDTLTGPLGGWAKLIFVVTALLFAATVYALIQMLNAESTRDLVLWATAVVVGFMASGFTKEWFFSRMNMLSILREIKKAQLQLAMLNEDKGEA